MVFCKMSVFSFYIQQRSINGFKSLLDNFCTDLKFTFVYIYI